MGRELHSDRRALLARRLREAGLGAAVFLDDEAHRDPGLRWLSGQPGDGVLLLSPVPEAMLAAWDIILAGKMARVERLVPYTDYGRTIKGFLERALPGMGIPPGASIELPPSTTWLEFRDVSEALREWKFVCPGGRGAASLLVDLRAVKDEGEIGIYRRAALMTDRIIDGIQGELESGRMSTEADAALFIERYSRELGAEGTGFETLAAGPSRSWGIHAFPSWGAGPFGTAGKGGGGLSILDFGIKLDGYTTDVTLGIARGRLNPVQEEMVSLVEEAYEAAENACAVGVSVRVPARACDEVFSRAGWAMPHALGHGIGLEAHEAPLLRDREDNDWTFLPGMVFTLEPGLYHPDAGGIRLENDYLMTERGPEKLTNSRIIRLA